MESSAAILDRVVADLDRVLASARSGALGTASDIEKMDLLRTAGDVLRRVEALIVETVANVDGRPAGGGVQTFPARFGCRNMNELLQRVLRTDAAGASRVVKAAAAVHRDTDLTSGDPLPPLGRDAGGAAGRRGGHRRAAGGDDPAGSGRRPDRMRAATEGRRSAR